MRNQETIIILIVVMSFLALGMYMQNKYEFFSILPSGQNNHNSDCSFITNIDYGANGESLTDYSTSGGIISIDWDGDGIKENYKRLGTSSSTGDTCSGKTLITTTPLGLRVVQWKTSLIGGVNQYDIAVCSVGTAYTFRRDNINTVPFTCGTEPSCISNCQNKQCGDDGCGGSCGTCTSGSCTNNQCVLVQNNSCNSGETKCISTSQYQQCLSSGLWSGTLTCSTGICSNNKCQTVTVLGDTNGDGKVDRTELGVAISQWMNNQISRDQLGQIISTWVGGQ